MKPIYTIKEIIELLKQYPEDYCVIVQGEYYPIEFNTPMRIVINDEVKCIRIEVQ
jgi:hypothetical protein